MTDDERERRLDYGLALADEGRDAQDTAYRLLCFSVYFLQLADVASARAAQLRVELNALLDDLGVDRE